MADTDAMKNQSSGLGAFGGDAPPMPQGLLQPQSPQRSQLLDLAGGQLQAQQGQQTPPPSIDHHQAVTMLRHFDEIEKQMTKLSKNPKLGKENIRPDVFSAAADLLAKGFMTLPQLMNEIKTVPNDPSDQKLWVGRVLRNAQAARLQIMDDHRTSNPGTGNWKAEIAALGQAPDLPHYAIVSGISDQYRQRQPLKTQGMKRNA